MVLSLVDRLPKGCCDGDLFSRHSDWPTDDGDSNPAMINVCKGYADGLSESRVLNVSVLCFQISKDLK